MSKSHPADLAADLTEETQGLVVEAQRAYLGWQGTLRTLNRAKDAEAAARGAYTRLSRATAQAVHHETGEALHPEGPEMADVRRLVWKAYLDSSRPSSVGDANPIESDLGDDDGR